ncbi:MAG: protein-ADP-ribose hydrolase [Actinomyces sp.]|uniref:protein-ADP-ribose hydrolase n=1 Tax=Actinomyces sp. TaxID=29317 RepID=UPI0026DB4833|nr:protein-ADP-ribose hydrolase [Actinomyces sp.]MDO4242465.1 protein-ADP-ribose hydrolase [Actinomyces sp.]
MTPQRRRQLLTELLTLLSTERYGRPVTIPAQAEPEQLWTAVRALLNTRPPLPCPAPLLEAQDELLQGLIADRGVHAVHEAAPSPTHPRVRLWRGDITTLEVDAILNAANSQMLGCWSPGHHCIDNAIHTFAGVQLRAECARIMEVQGHEEPTGRAVLTEAYNLPSRHVIHTVGPIAAGHPTPEHEAQLASCYRSCLDLAAAHRLGSVALCCISTGVFGFPQDQAARIAVSTVSWWQAEHGEGIEVVFTVFTDLDEGLYRGLLGLNSRI